MLSSSAFWQTQNALHGKDSNALPAALLVTAGGLVTYRHMTEDAWEGNQLKTFLALIMIQMLPLVLIEIKIPSCPDPMALLSRFGSKVLLMHASVLTFRAIHNFIWYGQVWDVFYCLLACAALRQGFGFRMSLQDAVAHRDVLGLLLLATLTGIVEEAVSYWSLMPWQREAWNIINLTIASCNYAEILAFVPAVLMVWRGKGEVVPCSPGSPIEEAKTQRAANWFFGFLLVFYLCEDIGNMPGLWADMPLAAMGHAAHFVLVLDFAGFMLAHVYDPATLKEGWAKMTASFGAGTLV